MSGTVEPDRPAPRVENIHREPAERFCAVLAHRDGSVTFDAGVGGEWIETDCMLSLEGCR